LQALRDDLAKLGFLRQPQQEQPTITPASPVDEDSRTVRPMRQSPRVFRATRLSPVQRLAQVVKDVHRWLREGMGVEQKEAITEKIERTESIKPTEGVKATETVKPPRTVEEAVQEEQPIRRKLDQGIRPRHPGHSRGIRM